MSEANRGGDDVLMPVDGETEAEAGADLAADLSPQLPLNSPQLILVS